MGRPAKGWQLREKRGYQYVRFTHEGQRFDVATGERDAGKASVEAKRIYGLAIAGKLGPKAARSVRQGAALDEVAAGWLADLTTSLDPETVKTYLGYCRKHWVPFFQNNFAAVDDRGLAEYARARLGAALRKTLRKELSAIFGLLTWALEKGLIDDLPKRPRLPKTVVGVRSGPQRETPVELSQQHVQAILDALPEWGGKGQNRFRVRDYFVVAYETGLRPATLRRLEVPKHYSPGTRELVITDRADKARFGRTVPLSEAAAAALDRCAPDGGGLVFGRRDYRWRWAAAVAEAKAPAGASPYDLRHGRATHLLDDGGSLSGVGYLLGHKQLTTTDRYAKANRRAAEALVNPKRKQEP